MSMRLDRRGALATGALAVLTSSLARGDAPPPDQALELADRFARGLHDGLDADGRLRVVPTGAKEAVPAGRWLRWGRCLDVAGPFVQLAGGGRIPGAPKSLAGDVWTIEPSADSPWRTIRIPRSEIRACWLAPPVDPWRRDQASSAEGPLGNRTAAGTDRLWLRDGSVVDGELAPQDAAERTISFQPTGAKKPASIPLERTQAIALRHVPREDSQAPLDWVGFADGTLLPVAAFRNADGATWRVEGLSGATFERSARDVDELLAGVVHLERPGDDATPVVGMRPIAWRHEPLIGEPAMWSATTSPRDQAPPARVAGDLVWRAIRQPPTSLLAWTIPDGARTFAARVAIEDRAGDQGSVRFQLSLDVPAGGWKNVFDSGVVRGGEPAREVVVPVAGAKRLRWYVEMADRGDVRDYAVWLAPRFAR